MPSIIQVDQFENTNGTKTVTVTEIYNKVKETNAQLTALTSPTAKVVTVDEIYAKVNEGKIPVALKSTSFAAVVGEAYRIIAGSVVATLPLGSTVATGGAIQFTKLNALSAVIQASGADTITINSSVGDSVAFDTAAEITIVWNGTGWEV